MTESVVALPNGSVSGRSENPRASARARVNGSVTHGERRRPSPTPRTAVRTQVGPSRMARVAAWPCHAGRVMYLDAADSWIVKNSTPSIRQVWSTDYAASIPGDYAPFRYWCRAYRYPAVAAAAVLDSAKWMLIHPVRGPLFLSATAGGVAAVVL